MLRTIEEILGIEPLGLYDRLTRPMTDVFDLRERDAAWWTERTRELDSTQRDNPRKTECLNRILWSLTRGWASWPIARPRGVRGGSG
jgi:hypothetical protein